MEGGEAFWKDLKPLQLTSCIPHLQDEVLVAGFGDFGAIDITIFEISSRGRQY